MSTQLDLFGDATEQTSALATVLVRSYVRKTKGTGEARSAPMPPHYADAKESVEKYLASFYPAWKSSRQVAEQAPCPARWVLKALAELKAETKHTGNGGAVYFRLASAASRAKSPETVGIHPETVGTADPDVYTGRCEHCGRTSSITPEYRGTNQLLHGIACATCPLCRKDAVFMREGSPSPVPHNSTRTSKAAARHMEQTGKAQTQEQRVLAAVQASGARGMIREEIHHATGISVASVCGRVNTLVGKGLLSETGETRRSSAGVMQSVVVASKGKDTDHEQ